MRESPAGVFREISDEEWVLWLNDRQIDRVPEAETVPAGAKVRRALLAVGLPRGGQQVPEVGPRVDAQPVDVRPVAGPQEAARREDGQARRAALMRGARTVGSVCKR